MRKLLLFIIISILLGACKGQGRFQSMLDIAASVVNNRPDSTLFLLDSLSPDYHNFSKSTRMRYYLLMLMAQNKCDTIFHNDSLQKALVNYFDHHGTPNEKMWAHYLLGRAFYDMGLRPENN